jgi:hypothetical protein
MSSRRKSSPLKPEVGKPSGLAGAGSKSAMEEMMRRAGKQAPVQATPPRSAHAPGRGEHNKK